MIDDRKPYEDLLAAIVIQAAGDYCDAYNAGLITEDDKLNIEKMRQMIYDKRKHRCRFPKWMDSVDIQTAVLFLFHSDYLEETIPARWNIDADSLRQAVRTAARQGRRISSYFVYAY